MSQVMYLDETPVVTLCALLSFCDDARRYYKFGTNHWAMFRQLRGNDNDMRSAGGRIGMEFPKNRPPKELVEAVQKFMRTKKVSDETLRAMFINTVPHHAYLSKYSISNPEQLRREFEQFKIGVVKSVNKRSKENGGIKMLLSRPIKGSKKNT